MSEQEYSRKYFPGTRTELLAKVKNSVSNKRYQHILGVEQAAVRIAKLNKFNIEKASIAALVHDYAKERSAEEFKKVITDKNLDADLLNWNNYLWHGVVGAEIIKDELHIENEEILNAVRRHTVGAENMTILDKIVYVADYVENGRIFPDVNIARTLAYSNLDDAVAFETKHTLEYLISTNGVVYPDAILTYNKWVVK
ncbi:bis(5'-nucleosyl)-tetraphosphatase (symmetrical) YqeK [Liquorilactobacillus mali]|uniref:bis(5'-nucleosyl)-tetraphosphatase (symmetrical) YqeK n=1 Tax=Liquorilactobacillus mali TaxID=1618 RepID=UPI002953263B|nr:bis(5'-nucleosyl)-tetraphosphatase (symmetrical) YqeK [Liquorilactobacillus mali]MDV7757091.1 HD domain-containing protein [Liquorilactobacillus mali]